MTARRLPNPANDNLIRGVFNYFGNPRGNFGAQLIFGAVLAVIFLVSAMGIAHQLGLAH